MKTKLKEYAGMFTHRKTLLVVVDAFILVVASLIANFLLSLFGREISTADMLVPIVMGTICSFAFLFICGAYSKMWRYFRIKDYLSCVFGVFCGLSVTSLFAWILDEKIPVSFVIVHMIIAIIGVCMFRMLFRTAFIEISETSKKLEQLKRTMIIGGGTAGRMLLTEIENARKSPYDGDKVSAKYLPVCIIDDDQNKVGQSVMGVEIVGTTSDIVHFANEMKIEQIIFAVPSAPEDERMRVLDICSETKLPIKTVPFIGNLIFDENNQTSLLKQVRDIKVEDLLGREPIKFDNDDIRNFISGKVCMVTGGGGSIGSELVRQIAKYSPSQIIIVDIYENNAYEIQQELFMEYGKGLNLVTLIASVRDYYRINQIFERYKPQVVFHAAAHKHVPLMEVSPMEAIKNNIVGTFNVASLAQFHLVEKFVMISTDKAVNPTNVMGASKRCCEMIVQYLAQQKDTTNRTEFVTTRFGNVLGSNGSVIPLFKKQIEQGKPVTVTHPDIIRYFMTIPEAVSLVMEAAAIAHGGEIFVLDMGKPVRIVKLAENLIRMYGKVPYEDIEIKFVGLRPGEKIKEELLMDEEGLQKTANKLIYIGTQIEIDADTFAERLRTLRDAAEKNEEAIAVSALHDMVPTFITPDEFNQMELKKTHKALEDQTESAKNPVS